MTFAFKCAKDHRFSAECTAEEAELLTGKDCIVPGCKEKMDRDYSGIAFSGSVSGVGDKMSKLRKENRERTAEARKMAMQMQKENPVPMTELEYIPSGEGGKSRFGGDRIKVPTSVIDSLKKKAEQFTPPPEGTV